MCRLFGFRSVIDSQVHRSLVSADNALGVQSRHHPHGWGVAYYLGHSPHVVKSAASAMTDKLFHRVSGIVSSQTVLAHVRRATQGEVGTVNCHPFQFGRWTFAHNGNIRDFRAHRDAFCDRIPRALRRFVLGDTDSEAFFHLLLGHMARRGDLHAPDWPAAEVVEAIRETVTATEDLVGAMADEGDGDPSLTYLSFLITDGSVMLAHQGGQQLFYSTHKETCSERETCPHFSRACEHASEDGYVNHLIFASETLLCENVWQRMQKREIVGVDRRMRLHVWDPPGGRHVDPSPTFDPLPIVTPIEGDAYGDGEGI